MYMNLSKNKFNRLRKIKNQTKKKQRNRKKKIKKRRSRKLHTNLKKKTLKKQCGGKKTLKKQCGGKSTAFWKAEELKWLGYLKKNIVPVYDTLLEKCNNRWVDSDWIKNIEKFDDGRLMLGLECVPLAPPEEDEGKQNLKICANIFQKIIEANENYNNAEALSVENSEQKKNAEELSVENSEQTTKVNDWKKEEARIFKKQGFFQKKKEYGEQTDKNVRNSMAVRLSARSDTWPWTRFIVDLITSERAPQKNLMTPSTIKFFEKLNKEWHVDVNIKFIETQIVKTKKSMFKYWKEWEKAKPRTGAMARKSRGLVIKNHYDLVIFKERKKILLDYQRLLKDPPLGYKSKIEVLLKKAMDEVPTLEEAHKKLMWKQIKIDVKEKLETYETSEKKEKLNKNNVEELNENVEQYKQDRNTNQKKLYSTKDPYKYYKHFLKIAKENIENQKEIEKAKKMIPTWFIIEDDNGEDLNAYILYFNFLIERQQFKKSMDEYAKKMKDNPSLQVEFKKQYNKIYDKFRQKSRGNRLRFPGDIEEGDMKALAAMMQKYELTSTVSPTTQSPTQMVTPEKSRKNSTQQEQEQELPKIQERTEEKTEGESSMGSQHTVRLIKKNYKRDAKGIIVLNKYGQPEPDGDNWWTTTDWNIGGVEGDAKSAVVTSKNMSKRREEKKNDEEIAKDEEREGEEEIEVKNPIGIRRTTVATARGNPRKIQLTDY
jgi:hypothetical protein